MEEQKKELIELIQSITDPKRISYFLLLFKTILKLRNQ